MRNDSSKAPAFSVSFSIWTTIFLTATALLTGLDPTSEAQSVQTLNGSDVLGHLSASIALYRDSTTETQALELPDDLITYEDNARNISATALKLAFQSAKTEADLIAANDTKTQASKHTSDETDYDEIQSRISKRLTNLHSQISAINQKIATSAGQSKKELVAQRTTLQAQLDSMMVLQGSVQQETAFIETANETATSLQANISDLARFVPEVVNPVTPQAIAANRSPQATGSTSSGLVGEGQTLYLYLRVTQAIDRLETDTTQARTLVAQLRTPLRSNLLLMIRRASNAPQPGETSSGGTGDPVDPATLVADVKAYSNALALLNEESATLDQNESNLVAWRSVVSQKSRYPIESLFLHLAAIALGLASLMLVSKGWRALALRYIHDPHRRRQSLILRRVTIGCLMGLVLIVGFVSEFSSIGTFAGFTTAGIAVSLNAVFLSMAAYFLVIGRYGIRVGDRITVSGITGEVVDIGLIRLYLMEMVGSGSQLYPTGRLVEFSNSLLFQATTPLFKQIPGTDYSWHEVAQLLVPGSNGKPIQDKMAAVVASVYAEYRKSIEHQYETIEHRIEAKLKRPNPEAFIQAGEGGLEAVVRYPIEGRRATEIDGRVFREIYEAISMDAALKPLSSGAPKIRSVARPMVR